MVVERFDVGAVTDRVAAYRFVEYAPGTFDFGREDFEAFVGLGPLVLTFAVTAEGGRDLLVDVVAAAVSRLRDGTLQPGLLADARTTAPVATATE
jgi:hypothetical protein